MPRQRQYEHQLHGVGICFFVNAPFIIYALPRSRTYWLSRFLSYGGWACAHDELRHARSLDDVWTWFRQPLTGTIETAAAPFWRLLATHRPDMRTVVVRRPISEVVESLLRQGFQFDAVEATRMIAQFNRKLDQIEARVPGTLSVTFDDLANESVCARVFEYCLGIPHNPDWWRLMAPLNLQTDINATVRYFQAYGSQLGKMAQVARHRMLADMRPRKTVQKDDVTIQQETCEDWYRDGKKLFEEHSIELGEAPDDYEKRNWPLMLAMDKAGAMQIMTARCNGRMVGYHVCYVAPATNDASLLSSLNISIFVTRDFTGIGPRLQKLSLQALERRGVGEVNFRAGINADGPRLGAFYRRIGAKPIGQMYCLSLNGA